MEVQDRGPPSTLLIYSPISWTSKVIDLIPDPRSIFQHRGHSDNEIIDLIRDYRYILQHRGH